MPSFAQYDPVFRNLTGFASTSDPDGYRDMLVAQGVSFVEVPDMILPFNDVYVTEEGDIAERKRFAPSGLLPDVTVDEPYTVPPIDRYAPDGTVCDPAPGTVLTEGTTRVLLRAPGHYDHAYTVTVWTAEHERARLVAHAANIRWQREQAGAIWEGHPVATDDRSKVMIMGSVLAAQLNPQWSTIWQFMDGTSASVGAAEVLAMSMVMQAHVSDLFSRFEQVRFGVVDGSITDDAGVEEAMGVQS